MNMKDQPQVKTAQMAIRSLEDSLPIQLLKVHDLVMAYFRPMLHRFGMTDQQWRVLRAVASGINDFAELAQATHIQPASLSRMLITLQNRGWTTRAISNRDRRQRTVTMTTDGWALFQEASHETEAIYARLEADLSANYAELLAQLRIAVAHIPASRTP